MLRDRLRRAARPSARPPLRRATTTAPSSPSPTPAPAAGDALVSGAEEALETIDMAPLPRRPPGDRRPRRLPAGLARPRRPRRAPAPRRSPWRPRSAASACRSSSTASWPATRAGPSAPTSATAACPSSGCGWRRGSCGPDFGPTLPHRRGGATLVTARPPLAAFNVELDSGDVEVARSVAAGLRESGGGLPGVRAIGLVLSSGRGQVSTNVHDPLAVPLGAGGRGGARAGGAARRPAAGGRAGRPDPGRGPAPAIPRTCRCAASTPAGT